MRGGEGDEVCVFGGVWVVVGRGEFFILVGNSYSEGDVCGVAFVGMGIRSLDRKVIVSGCWVC